MVQAQLPQAQAQHLLVGHHHATVDDVSRGLHQVLGAFLSDDDPELLQIGLGADRQKDVAPVHHGVSADGRDFAGSRLPDAGNDHAQFLQAGNGANGQAVQVGVVHQQVHPFEALLAGALGGPEVLQFLRRIHPEDRAHEDHGEDDPENAKRVADGVAQAWEAGAVRGHVRQPFQRFLGRAEGGRVGGGTGKQAHPHREVDAQQMAQGNSEGGAHQHDACCQGIQRQALPAQRGQETRSDLHADGVNEQDQAEFLNEGAHLGVDVPPEMPEQDAREERARHAQADAPDLDAPDGQAHRRHTAVHQHALRGMHVSQPFHSWNRCRRVVSDTGVPKGAQNAKTAAPREHGGFGGYRPP